MPRAATEIVQEIIFAAVVDAITALRTASKGVPNTLLRDLQSLHPNTTFADLPKELQDSIGLSVRSAFTKLLKEGYSVSPTQSAAPPPRHQPTGDRHGRPDRGPSGRPQGRGPRPGGRPGGGGPGAKPGGSGPRGRPGGGKPRP